MEPTSRDEKLFNIPIEEARYQPSLTPQQPSTNKNIDTIVSPKQIDFSMG